MTAHTQSVGSRSKHAYVTLPRSEVRQCNVLSSPSLLLSSLELSDTKVYEPQIRALLGTASHFCEIVVLKLIAVQRAGNRDCDAGAGGQVRFPGERHAISLFFFITLKLRVE